MVKINRATMVKINRALRRSAIGNCPASAHAMLSALPHAVVAKLSSNELALLLDALWRTAQAAKALAEWRAEQEQIVRDLYDAIARNDRAALRSVAGQLHEATSKRFTGEAGVVRRLTSASKE